MLQPDITGSPICAMEQILLGACNTKHHTGGASSREPPGSLIPSEVTAAVPKRPGHEEVGKAAATPTRSC